MGKWYTSHYLLPCLVVPLISARVPDIGKLLDLYRTGGPVTTTWTTWKIQVLWVLQNFYGTSFFFNIRVPIEGLPTGFFLRDRRTGTRMFFIGPPLFSPVEDRGPVDFPMSGVPLISNLESFSPLSGHPIGSASLARSIRIRFHFRHRTGRIRSVSDHRAGRMWRSRHRPKTSNCLPGARDQVPALFWNVIERHGASVDPNSGAPITQSTFDMLRRMANPLSLLNWWLHKYDNEDDYALFQV